MNDGEGGTIVGPVARPLRVPLARRSAALTEVLPTAVGEDVQEAKPSRVHDDRFHVEAVVHLGHGVTVANGCLMQQDGLLELREAVPPERPSPRKVGRHMGHARELYTVLIVMQAGNSQPSKGA